jgi:TM2 domain-containing membrane protein YozV
MKRNPVIAGLLSLLVPGLGQIYAGEGTKGAAMIVAAVVIANLNIIILPLIALANPVTPTGAPDARIIWAYWIPRVVHDVASFWSIVFWVWAIVDAVVKAINGVPLKPGPSDR